MVKSVTSTEEFNTTIKSGKLVVGMLPLLVFHRNVPFLFFFFSKKIIGKMKQKR